MKRQSRRWPGNSGNRCGSPRFFPHPLFPRFLPGRPRSASVMRLQDRRQRRLFGPHSQCDRRHQWGWGQDSPTSPGRPGRASEIPCDGALLPARVGGLHGAGCLDESVVPPTPVFDRASTSAETACSGKRSRLPEAPAAFSLQRSRPASTAGAAHRTEGGVERPYFYEARRFLSRTYLSSPVPLPVIPVAFLCPETLFLSDGKIRQPALDSATIRSSKGIRVGGSMCFSPSFNVEGKARANQGNAVSEVER